MKDLSALTLEYCENLHEFVCVLDPSKNLSKDMVWPKLEEFVIEHRGKLDIRAVIGMAAARESRGVKLNSIWILSPFGLDYQLWLPLFCVKTMIVGSQVDTNQVTRFHSTNQ